MPPDEDTLSPADTLTVRDLRRRWKPTKERLATEARNEGLRIRLHRSCSWLRRVEEIRDAGDLDAILIFQWSSLNALYGRWDARAHQPLPERETLPAFLGQLLAIDPAERMTATLREHRDLALRIFSDEFLARYFWDDPGEDRARRYQRSTAAALTWFERAQTRLLLDHLVARVRLLRDQLASGSATCGGSLNRTAVARCTELMDALLPSIITVIIDGGADLEWGPICYPPLDSIA